jgi:hypothetical protein
MNVFCQKIVKVWVVGAALRIIVATFVLDVVRRFER